MKIGWKVKLSTFAYDPGDGHIVRISYFAPKDLLKCFMETTPGVLIGGFTCGQEIAKHTEAFWAAYRVHHPDHMVFEEHKNNLPYVLPLVWHGDEGRGKRRGQTVLISIESPIGIHTILESKRNTPTSCGCVAPDSLKRKFGDCTQELPARLKSAVKLQRTNMKGHSMLQHWPLFILDSATRSAHPQAVFRLLEHLAPQFKALFFDGFTAHQRNYCAAICGAKGDLKWFTKIACLTRSFEHTGRVRDIPNCHECLAGTPNAGLDWEDVGPSPAWAPTRWVQRPWTIQPPMLCVPFTPGAPEKMYKRDIFHMTKVGILRDVCGSAIVYFIRAGLIGPGPGSFDDKLPVAYSSFKLFCAAVAKSAALRSLSRAFLNYPSFDKYPWANSKGSDTILLLRWVVVQCTAFENDIAQNGADRTALELIRGTSRAALDLFPNLYSHGLFMRRSCAMVCCAELTRFINGYNAAANHFMGSPYKLFGLKPKLHLLRNSLLEMEEWLAAGHEFVPNMNMFCCEQNEDLIGRASRLSRRMDSRRVGERVLQACLLKGSLLYRRFHQGVP